MERPDFPDRGGQVVLERFRGLAAAEHRSTTPAGFATADRRYWKQIRAEKSSHDTAPAR
jgi:hypothetical protein